MSWIKKIFRVDNKIEPRPSEPKPESEEIYLHEDFYCQVELLPVENLNDLKSENVKIDDFASEHFDGNGFTDIYMRDGSKVKTVERNIDLEEFEILVLALGFKKMKRVYTGYGNSKQRSENTNAYSLDGATVFCDYKDRSIRNVWLDGFRFNQGSEYVKEMTQVLNQIGEKWKLTLNDWDLTKTIDLTDKLKIEAYITED